MFGRRVTLFKLLGFAVRVDVSWLIIVVLVTWSLAQGLFPHYYEGLPKPVYWVMGAFGALGLFVAIVFHELSHSLVARRYGLQIKGITLFIFGGVAEMTDEPPSAKAEFMMAIAGPLASVAFALACYAIYVMGKVGGWPVPVIGVLWYLAFINVILAGFNMIPGFPLDGGRILRSILWYWKGNLRWATRIASQIGAGFGTVLVILGIVYIVFGNFVSGIWWFLIGMFLRNASQMSYQHLLRRKMLEGETVRRFMKAEPVTVPPSITIKELVEDYIYRYHFKMFPVTDGDRLIGCITTQRIKGVPMEEWGIRTVGSVVEACSPDNTVSPDTDAMEALSLMNRSGASRLMVVEGSRLVGVIALKDMLRLLALKLDLEGDG